MHVKRTLIVVGMSFLLSSVLYAEQTLPIPLPAAGTAGGAIPQETLPLVSAPEKAVKLKTEKEAKPGEKGVDILIPVKKLEIIGPQDFPTLNITAQNVQALAEALRQKLVNKKQEMTIAQLRQIADLLTLYYRSQGLILAKVYIPPQKVNKKGMVKLEIHVGRLGAVIVEPAKYFSEQLLQWPFQNMLSKAVEAKPLESALLTLGSYPGYSGRGVMVKGKEPGTSDLVIKTEKEHRMMLTFGEDDNGSKFSGRNHHVYQSSFYNLFGGADRFTGMWLQNARPARGHYGGLSYNRRIFNPNLELGLAYSRNSYSLGGPFKLLKFTGRSNTGDIYLNQTWIRQRTTIFSTKLLFNRYQAKTFYDGTPYRRDNLSTFRLDSQLHHYWLDIGGNANSSFQISHGLNHFLGAMKGHYKSSSVLPPSRQGASGKYAVGQFTKFDGSASYLQRLFAGQNLAFDFEGQWSDDLLSSSEQFSMGGVNNVKAFPVSEYLMDDGIYASLKWISQVPFIWNQEAFSGYQWGQLLQFSFFAEDSRGWLNDAPKSQKSSVSLTGFGVGTEFNLPDYISFQIQWARPFGFSRVKPSDGKAARLWFSLYFNFSA